MSAHCRLLVSWVVLVSGCGDVKGTEDAAPPTCSPSCRPGFACVDGTCVSECNPVCDTGFTCTQGTCVADCDASEVRCGTACIDPLTDAMYCGAKGTCTGSDATAADFAGATCGAAGCVSGVCAVSGLVISAPTSNYNVFVAAGSPTTAVQLNVRVATGITVGSTTPAMPAFTTGALPAGSTVTLVIDGQIIGAGGTGGSGGNGGGGGGGTTPPCGRPGGIGGTAIVLTVPTTITNNGLIAGGGGGGGGVSGCNINGGGGGGAGSIVGSGGAQASLAASVAAPAASEVAYCGQDNGVRIGSAGAAGGATTGGAGGDPASAGAGGRGGDLGRSGFAALSCISDTVGGSGAGPGGAAGFAIRRGTQTLTIADGAYATGSGPIRGAVGP